MRRVKRAAVSMKPKQPYIDWANGLDEGGVKLGTESTPEENIYLVAVCGVPSGSDWTTIRSSPYSSPTLPLKISPNLINGVQHLIARSYGSNSR